MTTITSDCEVPNCVIVLANDAKGVRYGVHIHDAAPLPDALRDAGTAIMKHREIRDAEASR